MSYSFKKYVTDPSNVKSKLEKYGVAIIPNVISNQECNDMIDGIWNYFGKITEEWDNPIDKNNKESWKGFYDLYPQHSMLFQHWNIGHNQASWDLRQNPNIVNIFSKLWNVEPEDLLVSFDGLSFHPPPETTKRGWYKKSWYHSDQSFTRNDFECVQSWITGVDVEKDDATLAFYEKSNRYHKKFGKKFNITEKADWYKLSKEQEQFFADKGCVEKRIKCPKGSLVLWDSRTIHCGVESNKTRDNSKFRAVVYLCYQPKNLSNNKMIIKKQKAFNEIRTTSHWPSKVKLFPKNPRTYGKELPTVSKIENPKLSKLGKSLAGFS
jgi:ectoine hydroxylase-related dioxygenase (phytanoyl-CoA dioxygenase family)